MIKIFFNFTRAVFSCSLFVLFVGVFVYGASADKVAAQQRATFDLMHLWIADIERPALDYFQSAVEAGGVDWLDHPVSGNFYGIRNEFANRVALENPPSGVFWIGGEEPGSMVRDGLLQLITPEQTGEPLADILQPELNALTRFEQGHTSLPVVIHLQNIALINQEVFKRVNLEPPDSWEAFLAMSGQIKAAGIVPLAISDQRWQLRFLFTSILAERLSAVDFQSVLLGEKTDVAAHTAMTDAFSVLRALKPYTNQDMINLDWQHVIGKVLDGDAAMTITGDFAAPAIRNYPFVNCVIAPGNGFVIWSFDVLGFPPVTDPMMKLGQEIAIRQLTTRQNLLEFAKRKGGVPVVRDIESVGLDACSANSLGIWSDKSRVHFKSEGWRLQLNSLSSIVRTFLKNDQLVPAEVAAMALRELHSVSISVKGGDH